MHHEAFFILRAPQLGHRPRSLHENATSTSWLQLSQWHFTKPSVCSYYDSFASWFVIWSNMSDCLPQSAEDTLIFQQLRLPILQHGPRGSFGLDPVSNVRLAQAQALRGLGQPDPVRGRVAPGEAPRKILGQRDPPRRARRGLSSGEGPLPEPAMDGDRGDPEFDSGLVGVERSLFGITREGPGARRDLCCRRRWATLALANGLPGPLRRPCLFRMRAIWVSSNSPASLRTRSTVSPGVTHHGLPRTERRDGP